MLVDDVQLCTTLAVHTMYIGAITLARRRVQPRAQGRGYHETQSLLSHPQPGRCVRGRTSGPPGNRCCSALFVPIRTGNERLLESRTDLASMLRHRHAIPMMMSKIAED